MPIATFLRVFATEKQAQQEQSRTARLDMSAQIRFPVT
jgi:hypothetical protein